jgi:hypothetical protein
MRTLCCPMRSFFGASMRFPGADLRKSNVAALSSIGSLRSGVAQNFAKRATRLPWYRAWVSAQWKLRIMR